MSQIIERIKNEPVLICTLIGAVMYLLTTFGINVTADQQKAILAVTVAVLAIVARQAVVPARTLPE
jgi:hypothetical protein